MPGLVQPLLQPQLSEKQLKKLQNLYDDFAFMLDDPNMKFAKEEMMSAGLSDAIKDLAEEKDMKLSEEVISQWLQKRKKEKSKKKKTSQ